MPIPAKRVLVVDDDIDIAETLADYLRETGHTVRIAFEAEAALEAR